MDDLLIASMAVASTWCDMNKSSDDSSSESCDSNADGSGEDADVKGEEKLSCADHQEEEEEEGISSNMGLNAEKTDMNSDTVEEKIQNNQVYEANMDKTNSDDDDDSDIDLTENLANMIEEDDAPPTKKSNGKNQKLTFIGPQTENEIDPYTCPTDELEKLNVSVGGNKHDIKLAKIDDDGGIVVDGTIRNSLKIAGTIRSHIVEQRTIVVDSFIPSSLQIDGGDLLTTALDEGSLLVLITTKDDVGTNIASTLKDGNTSYSLQVIGKIMEVFGPVQRPLYVIRLPESISPRAEKDAKRRTDNFGKANTKMNDNNESGQPEESVDSQGTPTVSAVDTNEIALEVEDEPETERVDESDSEEDPWDATGKLTAIIKACPSTAVYCLMDHANLIDRDQIIRVSGKGCDASNMHDEEVGAKELEYSDDEEERKAKRKGKKKPSRDNNQRSDNNRGRGAGSRGVNRGVNRGRGNWNSNQGPQTSYQYQNYYAHPFPNQMQGYAQNQMYHPPNQSNQAPPHQNYAYAQPTTYQQQYQQQYQPYPQPQHYQQHFQQQQQQYATYPHGVPPPPPPPPPLTQTQAPQSSESDTVYYDYSGS